MSYNAIYPGKVWLDTNARHTQNRNPFRREGFLQLNQL